VLLAVETVLPDAGADLVRLQNADLAIVPTYLVDGVPAAPVAPSRADDRPDLGLTVQVVGLGESPGGGSRATSSTDLLFEQMAGWGAEARTPAAAGVPSGGTEAGDARPAAASAEPTAAATDAGLAVREWLDGLLRQGEESAAVVPVLAVEGLLAYLCWRGRRPGLPRRAKSGTATDPE
jgi:hypothetical protein